MNDHIAICVCTYRRPKMLAACLGALAGQTVSNDLRVSILVVDNESEASNAPAVMRFADECVRFPVHYVHQPRRGIAAARNAAVEKALAEGADWIAFMDDDAVADPDWIANLMDEDYRDVPVLMGANLYVLPEPAPFWAVERESRGKEGERCKTAYTSNVRFHADLVRGGLRFDESLGLMGGEDNELFARIHAMGFEIRRTLRAVTREVAHPERLTYRGQLYRAYWCAASELHRLAITRGRAGAMLRKAHTIPLNVVIGLVWLLGAVVVAPVSREAFRDGALEGGKKLAKAVGRLASLVGHVPQPYKHVAGL